MAVIECELLIDASIESVYHASQDYDVRYQWDPFPEKITLLHGATEIAKGVQVRVKAKNSLMMDVAFVQVLPPTRTAIVMVKSPIFLDKFAGSWIFNSQSPLCTHAKFRYVFTMKKWSIPLVSEAIAVFYFKKMVKQRLAGLKQYCEALN
jgi:hypothetical protein